MSLIRKIVSQSETRGMTFLQSIWLNQKLNFARFVWDVLLQRREMRVTETLLLQRWLNRGLARDSIPGLFYFTKRSLANGGEFLKNNFFVFSTIHWSSTLLFFPLGHDFVFILPCYLISSLVLCTEDYSKQYSVINN